jgi:glucodextranase-like protein/FecR-like protein
MASKKTQTHGDLVEWFTVSYRTVYLAVGLVLLAAGLVYFFVFAKEKQPAAEAPAPPSITAARFRSLEGNVRVKPVGQFEWIPADPNMILRKSDLVRTGPGAAAEIAFFDGTVVHVRPDSLITIEETSEDPSTKKRRVAWHISSGEVNFQTVRRNVPGSATEFTTPTVKATAGENTDGGIRVEESGVSDVKVFQGTSQVQTKSGASVALGASEALKIDSAGRPSPKQALPGSPALLAPMHQAEIIYPDPARATTLLIWKAVPNAVSYHVMLDYSAYFNRPLVDRTGVAENQVQLRALDTGKFYWRVAAVDKDGVEGAFSEFSRFTVTRRDAGVAGGGPPPPLAIDALDVRTNILQVKGRTEPGASVTVNGQAVDVQEDGSFNEYITLDKPGKQTVTIRSTGLSGGVREEKRSVVVVG